jgi:uncharacterized protein YlxW (UPF0749 family)
MSKKQSKRYASTIPELSQELDATQKSVASLRNDVTAIREMLSQIVRDRRWGL